MYDTLDTRVIRSHFRHCFQPRAHANPTTKSRGNGFLPGSFHAGGIDASARERRRRRDRERGRMFKRTAGRCEPPRFVAFQTATALDCFPGLNVREKGKIPTEETLAALYRRLILNGLQKHRFSSFDENGEERRRGRGEKEGKVSFCFDPPQPEPPQLRIKKRDCFPFLTQ